MYKLRHVIFHLLIRTVLPELYQDLEVLHITYTNAEILVSHVNPWTQQLSKNSTKNTFYTKKFLKSTKVLHVSAPRCHPQEVFRTKEYIDQHVNLGIALP
jgi:hypothetical protein